MAAARGSITAVVAPQAEVDIDEHLVRVLLDEQHPHLADMPLREVASGWDCWIYRLGDDLAVRLPRRTMSAAPLRHEQRWLPELAPGLPLPVPAAARVGEPGRGYPWHWSVVPWLPGEPAERRPPADWRAAAATLGAFLAALHRPAPAEAPRNPYRGTPLAARTEQLRAGLRELGNDVDRSRIEALWAVLVDTQPDAGPPLWLHGDLHPLNFLVHRGRLSGVIDFIDLAAGDRATDLSVAWIWLPPEHRETFRTVAGAERPIDDDAWRRARAWALALSVAYLRGGGEVAAIGRRTLDAVLAEDR